MTRKSKAQQRADKAADEITAKYKEAVALFGEKRHAKAREALVTVLTMIEDFPDHVVRDNDPWFKEVKADATYNVACMHGVLGENEQALDMLEKAFNVGFSKREILEADAKAEFKAVRGDPRFVAVLSALEVRDGPLTIERVIRDSIVQKTLTEGGVDATVDAEARACVVFHHEWVKSPEFEGVACLMLASAPNGKTRIMLVHDLTGKAIFPLSKIDKTKLQFIST